MQICMEGISAGGAQVQLNCTKSAKLSMNWTANQWSANSCSEQWKRCFSKRICSLNLYFKLTVHVSEKYMCLLHIEVLVICWQQHRDNYEHVICICLFHGNWTVQYHEQRQRLVCARYTYLQSLSLLVKLSDLLLMANLAKMSLFTHLVAFWRNVVIYALCRILVKCRDLRIFPGKKIRIPGTKNYYAGLARSSRRWGEAPWPDNLQVPTAHNIEAPPARIGLIV